MLARLFLILNIAIILISCSKDEVVYQPTEKVSPYKLYSEAYKAFDKNDFFNASKKFTEAELNFEDVNLAAKSAIMASFSLYGVNFYEVITQEINIDVDDIKLSPSENPPPGPPAFNFNIEGADPPEEDDDVEEDGDPEEDDDVEENDNPFQPPSPRVW